MRQISVILALALWLAPETPPAARHESLPGSARPADRASRIAFYSDRDGNYEIYSIRPDGSGLKRLTNHPADDKCPAWSPDGTKIAFISGRNGNNDIFIMDADGGKVRAITKSESNESHPAWSPDGKELVFHAYRRDQNWNIYIINIETREVRPLFTEPGHEYWPDWSSVGGD